MKKLLLIFTFWGSILSAQPQDYFAKANEHYQRGEFEQALSLYDSIYQQGWESAALHYNLGNTYFKLGELGSSILHYEKGLKLNPGEEEIEHNLKIAQERRVDRIESLAPNLFKAFRMSLIKLFTPDQWAVLSLIFILGALVGLLVYLFLQQRRIGFITAVSALLLSLFSLSMAMAHQRDRDRHPELIIMSPNAYVKSGPSNNAEDVFILHEGTKATQLEEFEDWAKIRLSDGKLGWLPRHQVARI